MNNQPGNEDTYLAVRKITVQSFFMNERNFIHNQGVTLNIELNQILGFVIDQNLVEFLLQVFYKPMGSNPDDPVLLQIDVQNIFEVSDLKRFYLNNSYIKLPAHIITNIVGISISHARALLSERTSGTSFQSHVLTIINAESVARHFFPYMFDEEAAKQLNLAKHVPK